MKRPKIEDFKREVYDGQDYADWYKEYYQALEKYVDELEQALRIHDVVGRSEQLNTDLENEVFNNDKDWATNDDVDEHFRSV